MVMRTPDGIRLPKAQGGEEKQRGPSSVAQRKNKYLLGHRKEHEVAPVSRLAPELASGEECC